MEFLKKLPILKGAFAARARQQEINQAHEKTLDAVMDNDLSGLQQHYSEDFNHQQKQEIICQALVTDNVEVFSKALEIIADGDPNYKLEEEDICLDGTGYIISQSLLHAAIVQKKTDIALMLASDPKTNVNVSGYSQSFFPGEPTSKEEYDSCLDAAEKTNMIEVLEILAEKEAQKLKDRVSRATARAGLA